MYHRDLPADPPAVGRWCKTHTATQRLICATVPHSTSQCPPYAPGSLWDYVSGKIPCSVETVSICIFRVREFFWTDFKNREWGYIWLQETEIGDTVLHLWRKTNLCLCRASCRGQHWANITSCLANILFYGSSTLNQNLETSVCLPSYRWSCHDDVSLYSIVTPPVTGVLLSRTRCDVPDQNHTWWQKQPTCQ